MAAADAASAGISYFETVTGFQFWDASTWSWGQTAGFVGLVAFAYEFLGWVVPLLFSRASKIDVRGKHHDALDVKDLVRRHPQRRDLGCTAPVVCILRRDIRIRA